MPQKTKFPIEEIIRIVKECMEGEISQSGATKKYGVSPDSITTWIRVYQQSGIEGLIPKNTVPRYNNEIKNKAVKDYLQGKGSLDEICTRYGIRNQYRLRQWIKWYNSHGKFKESNSKGMGTVAKGRKVTWEEKIEIVCDCIEQNKNYGKIAEKYKVSYQQIYGWVKKYEEQGVEGLRDRRGKRKPLSEMREVERLQAQIKLQAAENRRLQMENDLLKKLEELERGWTKD